MACAAPANQRRLWGKAAQLRRRLSPRRRSRQVGSRIRVARGTNAIGTAALGRRMFGTLRGEPKMSYEHERWTEPLDRPMPPPVPPDPPAPGTGASRESDRTLLVVVGIIAALALGFGIGAVLITGLGGHDTTTVTTVSRPHTAAPTRSASGGNSSTAGKPFGPTFNGYVPSDASYAYSASIPSGGGWSAPIESHPTSGPLLRTTLNGPNGALLLIDRTPSEVPQLGGGY